MSAVARRTINASIALAKESRDFSAATCTTTRVYPPLFSPLAAGVSRSEAGGYGLRITVRDGRARGTRSYGDAYVRALNNPWRLRPSFPPSTPAARHTLKPYIKRLINAARNYRLS